MTKSIRLVASEPHYLDHLQPIWDKLPDEHKREKGGDLILVGGYADVKYNPTKPYIYVEHGAGQSYIAPEDRDSLRLFTSVQSYYSGGKGHSFCKLFICPNEQVAQRWQTRYPDTPVAVVGSPRLDHWHINNDPDEKTVAVTFHWDALFTGIPETASGFNHYWQSLIPTIRNWKSQGWTVLGHHHPRYPAVSQFWNSKEALDAGVEPATARDVLDRASVLVADNTSMQAEFLSLGRRVVWLNIPQYRRDVSHGGRFWDWPEMGGTQIESPDELTELDLESVPVASQHPYSHNDGNASTRAKDAIINLISI